jgi:hypothetical protein
MCSARTPPASSSSPDASGEGWDGCRQRDGAKRAGNQMAAAHAEGMVSGGWHVLIS